MYVLVFRLASDNYFVGLYPTLAYCMEVIREFCTEAGVEFPSEQTEQILENINHNGRFTVTLTNSTEVHIQRARCDVFCPLIKEVFKPGRK